MRIFKVLLAWRERILGGNDQTLVRKIEKLFQEADQETAQFSKAAGLHCLSGCGHCCENPHIEATAIEFLPLAQKLWKDNETEQWLVEIDKDKGKGRCVFYKPDFLTPDKGRCGIYAFRPLICRLYGFSAGLDRQGEKRLTTCSLIKLGQKEKFQKADNDIKRNLKVPIMQHFSMKMSQLDSPLGKAILPINKAIKVAIEKVGFKKVLLSAYP